MPAPGSFQATLDAQMSSGAITPVSSMEVAQSPWQIPASTGGTCRDLSAYLDTHRIEDRNGRLTRDELTTVSGGWGDRDYALLPPAAGAYEQMRSAAARDGVNIQIVDGYRSWESQSAAYDDYLAGRKKETVAAPGTSQHGNGLAIDVSNGSIVGKDDPEWQWLQQNASRYGWYPISNETWHWEFRGT
jgi:hypothetical protein